MAVADRRRRPAGPARVDEPHAGAVLGELLAEHARVDGRPLRQEGRAEAGREGRLGRGHADLRARELRGEPREEVVAGLRRVQARDRRQDGEGVRGEEDDLLRMPRHLGRQGVRDLLELVGGARVLGLRVVVEVEPPVPVDDDVLEHGPERVRGGEDLGLGLGGEVDRLRVAATLEVEDAVVAPSVLVVSDQPPLGIGGERRLPRAGEAEEDRDVAVRADVGRAVHRQDTL